LSEEVEVGGEETGVDVDSRSGLAFAELVRVNPAIFDAGEAVAIEIDGALGAGSLAQNLCVKNGDY
jgi:hypothetical protein